MSKKVLVIGGTGMVGSRAVAQLAADGHTVTALVRDPQKARRTMPTVVRLVAGDLTKPATLRGPLAEADSAVLVMPLSDGRRNGFVAERDGTANIVAALPNSRSVELIKLSEIGAGMDPSFFDLECKAAAERAIQTSGHPFVLLRPTWFMEAWPLQLLSMGKFLVVGSNRRSIHWVALDDMARWLSNAVTRFSDVAGRTLTAQGRDALTFAEAGAKISAATGRGLTRLPVGALAPVGWFSPRWRTVHELFRYYDRHPEPFEAQDTWDLLGAPTIGFDDFAATVGSAKRSRAA